MVRTPRRRASWFWGLQMAALAAWACAASGADLPQWPLEELFRIPYGTADSAIGYTQAIEAPEPWTVKAWTVTPRGTLLVLDGPSGLLKEFATDGRLVRTLPALKPAWERALQGDDKLRRRCVRADGSTSRALNLCTADSVAEDSRRRTFVYSATDSVMLILDAEGTPILDEYDEEGELVAYGGWAVLEAGVAALAGERHWDRIHFDSVAADTSGDLYLRCASEGYLQKWECFLLAVDPERLAITSLIPAPWPTLGGAALRLDDVSPGVLNLYVLDRRGSETGSMAIRSPREVMGAGGKPAGASAVGAAWLDAAGRPILKWGDRPDCLVAHSRETGDALAWAPLPRHERQGVYSGLPQQAPGGGIWWVHFGADSLRVLCFPASAAAGEGGGLSHTPD